MLAAVRHQRILTSLRTHGGLSVTDLSGLLGVSASTVRRDLDTLQHEGVLQRTFGGAVLAAEQDDPLDQVQLTNAGPKHAIAAAAAALVSDEMTLILDIGSTTLALAQQLRGRRLTIVTASLPVFQLFADDPTAQILVLGGRFRGDYRCTTGPMTVAALGAIRADLAFVGCSGLSADGTIRDTTLDQVTVKRAIQSAATGVALLADASKFPGKGSYAVSSVGTMQYLVTDRVDLGGLADVLAASGTEIVRAGEGE